MERKAPATVFLPREFDKRSLTGGHLSSPRLHSILCPTNLAALVEDAELFREIPTEMRHQCISITAGTFEFLASHFGQKPERLRRAYKHIVLEPVLTLFAPFATDDAFRSLFPGQDFAPGQQ